MTNSIIHSLDSIGWNHFFHQNWDYPTNYFPARVAAAYGCNYQIYSQQGEMRAELSGKARNQIENEENFVSPAVGDWVAVSKFDDHEYARIHDVLPRKSKFSRKAVGGGTKEQVVAVNIDTIFLVMGLDQDFNLRRLERFLTLVWESGSEAVVVLNKSDLCENIADLILEVSMIAMGVPVVTTTATENSTTQNLEPFLERGKTVALLGSSGVGKSTITNQLLGYNRQKVKEVREFKDRGQHTTTHRELLLLPGGGLIMDTPGMRAVQMWAGEETLEQTFEDIEQLSRECSFRDCEHQSEPGCAIQEAIEAGEVCASRFRSYLKLQREIAHLERKRDQVAQVNSKRRWKKISKEAKKKARRV